MSIIQRIQSAVKRPLSSIAGSLKEGEDIPLEHDPVGEFLESKKLAVNRAEDEGSEAANATSVPPREVKHPVEANIESAVSAEIVEAVVQPAEGQLESPIQSDPKAETPAAVLPDCEKEKGSQVAGAASEAPAETKVEPPVLESGRQRVEAANMTSADSPPEDEKIESVLEVFRSEELAFETTSTLSKELGDTDVYSLLDESKQVAQIAKKVKKVCPE
jgi:hypothetical protein